MSATKTLAYAAETSAGAVTNKVGVFIPDLKFASKAVTYPTKYPTLRTRTLFLAEWDKHSSLLCRRVSKDDK